MPTIGVNFDTSGLDKTLPRYQKNLAYSTAQALRASVLEAQRRIRESLRIHFHIRQAAFMDRSIKIFVFPSVGQNRPYAEIGIDNKSRLLLSIFEQGGQRTAFKGRNVAVPITGGARPGPTSSVRADLTFQALNFRRGAITQAGRQTLSDRKKSGNRKRKLGGSMYIWQGAQRTFILPSTPRLPLGGVFQANSNKHGDIKLLYSFKQSVQLRAVLNFVETCELAFDDVFKETFYRAFYRL